MHGLECNTRQYIVQEYLGVWYNHSVSFFLLLYVFFFRMGDYWMEGMAGVGRMCRSGFAFLTAIAIFVRFLVILICIFPYKYTIYNNPARSSVFSSLHFFFLHYLDTDLSRIPALSLFRYSFYISFLLHLIFSRESSFSSSSPVSIVNSSAVVRCSCMHLGLCLSLPRPDTHNTHTSHPQDLWRRCIASLSPFRWQTWSGWLSVFLWSFCDLFPDLRLIHAIRHQRKLQKNPRQENLLGHRLVW